MSKEAHYHQFGNADLERTGRGAMVIAHAMQNIPHPGERLAALVFMFKTVIDHYDLNVGDLMTVAGKFEKKAREEFKPEFSGAKMYIENELEF